MDNTEKNVIVVGRPRICPVRWPRWLRAKRVKSGMFSDRVDQNAIIAISDGGNTFQNALPQPRLPGCDNSGPGPPALPSIQISSATNTTSTNGAAQFSNRLDVSMPREMMPTWIPQNAADDS